MAVRRGMARRPVVFVALLLLAPSVRASSAPPCSLQEVEISPGLRGVKIVLPDSSEKLPPCTLDQEYWRDFKFKHENYADIVVPDFPSQAIAATDHHDSGVAGILCINQRDYQRRNAVDSEKVSNVLKDESTLKKNNEAAINDRSDEKIDLKDQLEVLKSYKINNEETAFYKRKNVNNDVLNFDGNNDDEQIDSLKNNIIYKKYPIIINDDVYKYEIVDDPESKLYSTETIGYINDINQNAVKKNEKHHDNRWKSKQWKDLSHDIDINYPNSDSEVILDVEGVNVEKNIFDKTSGDVDEPNDEDADGIETLDESVDQYGDTTDRTDNVRFKRDVTPWTTNANTEAQTLSHLQQAPTQTQTLRIRSLRVDRSSKEITMRENGVPELLAGSTVVIRIFGEGINEDTQITFTHDSNIYGALCEFPATGFSEIIKGSVSERSALVEVTLPSGAEFPIFYICAKNSHKSDADNSTKNAFFIHQGSESWLQLSTFDKLLPLWASIGIISVCLFFSALFSGLNLGLMSLDRTELKILCNTGTEKEKEYARVIQPVRDHGNYLLCSILLGNVAVNSTFTILLDSLTSGLIAVISSTLLIVLLGEITPQAICSRHGLAVGAKTIHITKGVMGLTFPLSYPVSKLLDVLLGEEIGNVYNRERLKELVKVTNDINDLDKDEVNIISGALELHKKTVSEVMTKIEDVFMLDYEAVLDFETVSEIMKTGFSRIPVYEGTRSNIVAMLYIKDLVFIDPDDNTPLKTLCQFYQNQCNFLFDDVTLDVIFKQFKEGHKGHMAFVQHVNSEGEGDPFYETIGLVTLEDVIEELIQAEIVDETDVFTDNKSKRRRNRPINKLQDFGVFAERRENQRIRISPQLTLATFQYLSTSVDAFKPEVVSETILRRLLKQDIIHHVKYRGKERPKNDPSLIIYEQGKTVDYFVLILEGRVEVTVGRENLVFESGPFTYFGSQALTQNIGFADVSSAAPSTLGSLQSINMESMLRQTFIPDYSVRAVTEVFYISIKKSLYLAAKRATLMQKCAGQRTKSTDDAANEQFDDEVEKLLHSLEEEPSPVELAMTPSQNATSYQVSPSGRNGSTKKSQQSLERTSEAPTEQSSEPVPHESSALLPS